MAAATSVIAGIGATSLVAGLGSSIAGGVMAAKQQEEMNKRIDEMNAIARQKLEFAQDIYSDWQEAYGPINSELSTYYANLSADSLKKNYADDNLAASNSLMKNVDAARQNLQNTFRKQGMANSGAAASAELKLATDAIGKKTLIDYDTAQKQSNAAQEAINLKQNYYNMGLAEKGVGVSAMSDAYNTQIGAVQGAYNNNAQQQQNWGNLTQMGLGMVGSGMGLMASAAASADQDARFNKLLGAIGKK